MGLTVNVTTKSDMAATFPHHNHNCNNLPAAPPSSGRTCALRRDGIRNRDLRSSLGKQLALLLARTAYLLRISRI